MISIITNHPELSFETFVDRYLENHHYELIDRELIDLEPTGLHEQVTGLVNRKLNVEIDRLKPRSVFLNLSGV